MAEVEDPCLPEQDVCVCVCVCVCARARARARVHISQVASIVSDSLRPHGL